MPSPCWGSRRLAPPSTPPAPEAAAAQGQQGRGEQAAWGAGGRDNPRAPAGAGPGRTLPRGRLRARQPRADGSHGDAAPKPRPAGEEATAIFPELPNRQRAAPFSRDREDLWEGRGRGGEGSRARSRGRTAAASGAPGSGGRGKTRLTRPADQ